MQEAVEQDEVLEQLPVEHRREVDLQVRRPGERGGVAEQAEHGTVRDDPPQVAGGPVQAVLHHRLRGQAAGGGPLVEVLAPGDEVDGQVLPGVADREDLGAVVGGDAGVQPGEAAVAVLVEEREQPVLGGEAARVAAVADRVAQHAPGALEVVPVPFGGVLDGADADDVVVGGRGRGDVLAGHDAGDHVGGEQAADDADRRGDLGRGGGGHYWPAPWVWAGR